MAKTNKSSALARPDRRSYSSDRLSRQIDQLTGEIEQARRDHRITRAADLAIIRERLLWKQSHRDYKDAGGPPVVDAEIVRGSTAAGAAGGIFSKPIFTPKEL